MITLRRLVSVMAVVASLTVPAAISAQSPSTPTPTPNDYRPGTVSIVLEPFAEGLSSPVFATSDGSGSGMLYVVEQGGTIRVVDADGVVTEDPFLDIADRVEAGGEQGLLGLAFHPGFESNGRLFVYYTNAGGDVHLVTEFHAVDGVVDPSSERLVLEMRDFAGNHNGGMLAFDAEGMLLIGTGDGGGGGDPERNGQDDSQLLGKLLRIDVDGAEPYAIPVNDPDKRLDPGARPEIRATGLRNPWRFSVDRATGDVFIGDVGQGEWEEIDVLPAGQGGLDYGWNVVEGPACFGSDGCDQGGFTSPVAWYDHGDGCTVVGGYVYRGSAFPSLEGAYVYGDYCSGNLWLLNAAEAVSMGAASAEPAGHLDGNISSFAQDDAGELYAIDLNGRILRLTAVAR